MSTDVPLQAQHIPWGEEGCIIDGNWHYGSVFSPRQTPYSNGYGGFIRNACDDAEQKYRSEAHTAASSSSPPVSTANLEVSDDNSEIHICEQDGQRLGRMFQAMDEDGDGRLTTDEIMRFLERLGLEMAVEEVELIVRTNSVNGNEYLTAAEFTTFYEAICGNQAQAGGEDNNGFGIEEEEEAAAICDAFEIFDQDGDGFISAMELADVLCRLRFAEGRDIHRCQRMIESADYNGDGFVDLNEFKQLVMKNKCSCSSPSAKSSPMVQPP